MSPLNNQQKQLLFDYCIGLTSEKQTAEAETLISSNAEASEIHSKLKSALAPLASIRPEPCPDDLAERTILRLNNFARSSQLQLQQLLAGEQARGAAVKSPFWRTLGKMAAAAAVFLIALGTFHTSSNYARFDPSEILKHNDFLYREQITYSFRICSNRSGKRTAPSQRPLMSDLNTVFEMLPRDYSEQLSIPLDKDRSTLNSINHNRRGQNVLFDDGGVSFLKKRCIGIIEDDPFTLQNTKTYNGTEVPSCEADDFLAP